MRTWLLVASPRLLGYVSETEVLHFEKLLHAVLRALAPDAGFLDSAEWRYFGRDDADVDTHDAGLDSFRHSPDAPDIAAVEVRRQAVFRVVGEADELLLRLETVKRGDGTERLLMRDFHVGLHVGEHRRIEILSALLVALASRYDACTMVQRIGDVLFHLFDRFHIDQRTLRHAFFETVTDLELAHLLREFRRERVVDTILHEQPVRAHTGLTRVAELGRECTFHRRIE